jgi:hypothetical protein
VNLHRLICALAARFAWPATGFALRFTGSSLRLELEDTPLPDGTVENDWLDVRVDGESAAPVALRTGRRQYVVASGLSGRAHDVEIAKRTEAEVGTVSLISITLDRGATLRAAPPRPERILEIVGDSISTGFGVDGQSADCPFTAATEDATRTYGALAARALDAEVWIVAWKGKGVFRNNDPSERDALPALYGRLAPEDSTSRYAYSTHPSAGDTRVEPLELWTDPADGIGCQFHPNRVTQQRMADDLARLLEAKVGW